MTTHPHHDPRHDVVVLGGGNAGASVAAHLLRRGVEDVVVVEPRAHHRYRPLLSYVAGRGTRPRVLTRPQRVALPPGATWHRDRAEEVDPVRRTVRLGTGQVLGYDDLVVAVGTEPDWDAWPGTRAAYDSGLAASSYVEETATRAWERLSTTTEGTVVFTLPPEPTSCGPTALKPLLLACDLWRRRGVLGRVRPVLLTAQHPTGVAVLDPHVRAALASYGVETVEGVTDVRIDGSTVSTGERSWEATFVHLVPPYVVPPLVTRSGLAGAGPGGLVDNDPRTFAHRTHPGLWVLGDCATTLNLHAGAALRKQAPVLAHNLLATRRGEPLREDEGYSAAPVTVSRGRLCFAEFGADGSPQPSVPGLDLARPRRSTYVVDRVLLPRLYWRAILRGRA